MSQHNRPIEINKYLYRRKTKVSAGNPRPRPKGRTLLVVVLCVTVFGLYWYMRASHIKVIDGIINDARQNLLDHTGLVVEYGMVKYSGWKFWELKTEIVRPKFVASNDTTDVIGTTDKILLYSNAISHRVQIVFPDDINVVTNIGGRKSLTTITWNKTQGNVLDLEIVQPLSIWYSSGSIRELVDGAHYFVQDLVFTVDRHVYMKADKIKFDLKKTKKEGGEVSNEVGVYATRFIVSKRSGFLEQCQDMFRNTAQDYNGDIVLDLKCAMGIESSDSVTDSADGSARSLHDSNNSNNVSATGAVGLGTHSDKRNDGSNGVTNEKENTSHKAVASASDEYGANHGMLMELFSGGVDAFHVKKCELKSNLFELSFSGNATTKEDILQYVDIKSSVTNYESMIDCYVKVMRNSMNSVQSMKSQTGPNEMSDVEARITDLLSAKSVIWVKNMLREKLNADGKKLDMHVVLKDPDGDIEIEGYGSLEKLFASFGSDALRGEKAATSSSTAGRVS